MFKNPDARQLLIDYFKACKIKLTYSSTNTLMYLVANEQMEIEEIGETGKAARIITSFFYHSDPNMENEVRKVLQQANNLEMSYLASLGIPIPKEMPSYDKLCNELHTYSPKYFEIIKDFPHFSNKKDEYKKVFFDLESALNNVAITTNDTWNKFFIDFIASDDEKKIFKIFFYSIFFAEDRQRWLLDLVGEGQDGKNVLIHTIQKIVNNKHFSASFSSTSKDDNDILTATYKSRFAYDPDNKNPKVISKSVIHSMTAGDSVTINQKYIPRFSANLSLKILICSNEPILSSSSYRNESSRLQIVRFLEKPQGFYITDLINKLIAEFPAFLRECKSVYEAHVKDNYTLVNVETILEEDTRHEKLKLAIKEYLKVNSERLDKKSGKKGELPPYIRDRMTYIIGIEDHLRSHDIDFFNQNEISKVMKSFGYLTCMATTDGKTITALKLKHQPINLKEIKV